MWLTKKLNRKFIIIVKQAEQKVENSTLKETDLPYKVRYPAPLLSR
jgi:hypothetical protein